MHYALRIKKFLYSQYFYGGLRIACGVSLPAVLMLVIFHERELGFAIAAGALGVCQVDTPGPLKHKRNSMLACTLIGGLAALATGLATHYSLALWLMVVPMAFMLSMLDVYGSKWPRISFATLFMMVATLSQTLTVTQAWLNALCLSAGGLWYTGWSMAVGRWQAERMEQQAIAESIFALAEYLRARARFYDPNNALDECYRALVARQVTVVDTQDAARDIVLRNLPVLRAGQLDVRRTLLFNLFINIVDLHQMALAAHTDYAQMREAFGDSDVMVFFRTLIDKAACDLDYLGLAVLQDRASDMRMIPKAELRALEYEIDARRKKDFPARAPEAYAALTAAFRRAWSVLRRIDKMHRTLKRPFSCTDTELRIDRALQNFLLRERVPLRHILSNLNLNSPIFRHALRVSGAMALGLWLGKLLPLTNAYWICLTIIVILKPGFSLTKQRNTQRLIGTVMGCALSVALILGVKSAPILLVVMFACMVLSCSFQLFNYLVSVIFTSAYVLILYHLLAPEGMRLIGERALDTIIGGLIATGFNYLFPYWEYRSMGPLVKKVIASTRRYFETVCAQLIPEQSTTRTASDLDVRLARKNTHIAFANLGNAFKRMMLEPKAQQKYVAELNDLLIQSHTLAAHIASVASILTSATSEVAMQRLSHANLARALEAVHENLTQAEAGASAPGDWLQTYKMLARELDGMVIEVEKTGAAMAEVAAELKWLAYQCKQMLNVSYLICKDAGAIQLSTEPIIRNRRWPVLR